MKYNIKSAESNAATGCSSVGWIDCFACGDRDFRPIRKPNAHDGQRSAACGGDSVAIRNFSDFCDFPVVPGILSDKEGVCNRMYRAVNRSPKFGCFEDKSYFCRRNFFKRFR